ncbi:uncharacterized protein B0H18DRAFT_879319, partial [Fomitopsis serialis]|uniref:uncharacterized protein n=1 Tax=Fomitopsis serialis TaxID=139415 RepID=UPI0020082086
ALCCYDWCLTFDREVNLIWKSKLSPITVLFCFLRYPAVLNTAVELLSRASWRWQSNSLFFASLRIYAIFDRNAWIAAAVLLLGLANPVIITVRPPSPEGAPG